MSGAPAAAAAQATGATKNTEHSQAPPAGTDPQSGQRGEQGGESKSAQGNATALRSIAPAPPPPRPAGRRSIGVALGGGGALGLSEIGALRWFEEHHIPVDMLAGASMGCMVAALYATGRTVDELDQVMNDRVFTSVFTFDSTYKSRSFRRREDSRALPNAITVGLRHGVSFRNSVLTDQGLNSFLDREFFRYNDQTEFNSLPIPVRCVATDLNDARTVTFARGSLPDMVRASVSLPAVFPPFELNGHEFVDGGILDNLPTETVHEMKADVVIALSLPLLPVGKNDLNSIFGLFQRSFSVAIEGKEREARRLADVVVMPELDGFTATDYLRTEDLAKRGYEAAERQKAALLPYAVSDEQWETYLAERRSRRRGSPGPVLRVRVKAPTESATRVLERKFLPLVNRPIEIPRLEALLDEVRNDGRFDADYTVGYTPASVHDPDDPHNDRPTIDVIVADKKTGPPFLLVGANVEAQSSGVTRATLENILVWQQLGGYGSELRANVKIGFLTDINAEYFRRLRNTGTSGGFFAVPHIGFLRQPFFIFQDQHRVAERSLERDSYGADAGWTDARLQQFRLGWEYNRIRWTTATGSDAEPNVRGQMNRARVRYVYDSQDRGLVPQFGLRSTTEFAYQYNAAASPNTPLFTSQMSLAHSLGKNTLVLAAEGGTMFSRDVAQPFRFTLGGPTRLTASAIDEYRGTDYFFVSPALLRRIAHLPAPLGQNIYVGGAYELGQMRAPFSRDTTRQDVYFGLVAETPLGVVTFAPAFGDAGRRKFVFTLGKLF